jgi:hypothetical protein
MLCDSLKEAVESSEREGGSAEELACLVVGSKRAFAEQFM